MLTRVGQGRFRNIIMRAANMNSNSFQGTHTRAAGTMPIGKGNLYGWVADPQSLKPGSKMPTIGLEPAELHAVIAYLETLE
jgi:cytochrome c oxidase subunit 2